MSKWTVSIPDGHFEALYREQVDPWRFASSDYEQKKYAATLAAIGPARIASALEVGCSIGVFTRVLATQCDRLLALDVAENALAQARARCADLRHVAFRRCRIPDEFPAGRFDLILLSEVLYYLVPDDIRRVAALVREALSQGGQIVLVHWTGPTNYPCTGDQAADLFHEACRNWARPVRQDRTQSYRLDVMRA
jgi:SAM-dependent methyltransferase